jgi:dTDP-4-dehydrorhamnose 3,5-epimerase-like enzyme
MIKDHNWPTEIVLKLEQPFVDDRGSIHPLVDVPMQSALLISSNKGTVRANHYHKTDWHYCYVVSGEIDYFHRPVGDLSEPDKVTVRCGQLFFTPPMVEHAMVFTKDTTFLTLSRNKRSQEDYEKDLVRVNLVNL